MHHAIVLLLVAAGCTGHGSGALPSPRSASEPSELGGTEAEHEAALARARQALSIVPERPPHATPVRARPPAPEALVLQHALGEPFDVSSDGALALASSNVAVGLVELATGRVVAAVELPAGAGEVFDVGLADDASCAVLTTSSADGDCTAQRAIVYRPGDGRTMTVARASNSTLAAAVRPDGQRIAVAVGPDGPCEYEEAEEERAPSMRVLVLSPDGARIAATEIHGAEGSTPVFSPDGARFAIVDRDGGLFLFDGEDARQLAHVATPGMRALEFHPSGGALLTIHDRSRVVVRDPSSGRELAAIDAEDDAIADAGWSGDGQRLIVRGTERVRVFHGSSLVPLWSYPSPQRAEVLEVWSDDGELRYAVEHSRVVHASGRTGRPLRSIDTAVELGQQALVTHGRLVSGSTILDLRTGVARTLGGRLRPLPADEVQWFGSTRLAVFAARMPDAYLTLWQPAGAEPSACTRSIYPEDMDFRSELFWRTDAPPVMITDHLNSGQTEFCVHGGASGEAPAAASLAGGRWILSHESGDELRVIDPARPEQAERIAVERGERFAAASADGMTIAVSTERGFRVLRRPDGRTLCRAVTDREGQIALAPDASTLAVRIGDDRRVFTVADGGCTPRLSSQDDVSLLAGGKVLEWSHPRLVLRSGPRLRARATITVPPATEAGALDDERFWIADGDGVAVRALTDGALERELPGRWRVSGTHAMGCQDDHMVVVDLTSGARASSSPCAGGRLSGDGRWIASADGAHVTLRRTSDGLRASLFAAHAGDGFVSVVIASDGRVDSGAEGLVLHRARGPLAETALVAPARTPDLLRALLAP